MTQERTRRLLASVTILGIPLPYFTVCLAVILTGGYLGVLPDEMIGGFAAAMAIGSLLMWVGNRIPLFGDIGGGTLLCVAVPGLLTYFEVLPTGVRDVVSHWYDDYGFVNFLIAALITGSLLGMNRNILLRAGARFAVPVLAGLALTMAVGAVVGLLTGYGVREALLFVVLPVMGGGVGAGAIPLSEMYSGNIGGSADSYLARFVPAIIMANVCCIMIAGVYNAFTRHGVQVFRGFNGNGRMLRSAAGDDFAAEEEVPKQHLSFTALAAGLLLSGTAFVFGLLVENFVPAIHAYAWMILAVALVKVFRLLPKQLEESAEHWYQLVTTAWIPAILVGVSFGLLDIPRIVAVVTNPVFLLLTVVTTVVSALAAGFFGWLVRMHFVEASITGGLCMADLGGSGDVAVLGASSRMQLMPFAQMSSRLGGAIVLLTTSLMLSVLG